MTGISSCPVEILHLIFSLLSPAEWHSLCLVNQKLREIAEPLLYSKIQWGWQDHTKPPPIIPFLRSVTKRPELASYVRSLKLEGKNRPRFGYWFPLFPIPVSETELESEIAFIQSTGVPYSDLWIHEICKGVTDALLALLLAQLSNLKFLDMQPVFLQRTTFIGMVLKSAICDRGKYRLPDFHGLRDVSIIFREGWDIARVTEKFQETADLLPIFYLPNVEHLALSIRSQSVYKWPTEDLPSPPILKSLYLKSIREKHLSDIVPLARNLEKLTWKWYYDFDLEDDINEPVVDLDQIATALSLAPPNLTEIKIKAAVELGGHDIDHPGVRLKGSLQQLANLHQVKRLQIPFAFLVGFAEDTTKRLHGFMPRNIEILTLTYDLTEQDGQYETDMPEWDWEDEAIFELLQSWLKVWESCTPCLRGIRILQYPENGLGEWEPYLVDRLKLLSLQTGIQIDFALDEKE